MQFEDMLGAGVIDPTKVSRTALQNAASIAGLLLTTEAVVGKKPEEELARPAERGATSPPLFSLHPTLIDSG